jgi:hypothetical protein
MSVRALMLVVLVVGGGLGWLTHRARVQREAVAAIEAAGGSVIYDWQWDSATSWLKLGSPTPGWLRRHLGPGFFEHITCVSVPVKGNDALMSHIGRLRHLQHLRMSGDKVTDVGLARLTRCASLRDRSPKT